jgi:hypothetical protein
VAKSLSASLEWKGEVLALEPVDELSVLTVWSNSPRGHRSLVAVAPDCVTMCPICLVNLRKAADGTLRVRDISEYLREGAAC